MRVLFINENIEKGNKGGDIIQMNNTKEEIEKKYDVQITLCTNIDDDNFFENCDLVHIFNVQTIDYTKKAVIKSHSFGLKIVLSPIFWDLKDACNVNIWNRYFGATPNFMLKFLKPLSNIIYFVACNILKKKTSIMFDKKKAVRSVLTSVDWLLPNSKEEMDLLIKVYGLNKRIYEKTTIAPNAIDYSFVTQNYNETDNLLNKKGYVLQVGAINPVKNQINVVKALKKYKDIPIVFIGKNCDNRYFTKLKKLSDRRGNVFFVDQITNRDVIKYYRNAICHILPSFRESPGLVTLEALANECQIIVANKKYCPIDYYQFKKYAFICNPYSSSSIKKCIFESINRPKQHIPSALKDYFDFYSYDTSAKLTYESYKNVL